MAEKQELEITISENGEVGINVLGAKGKNCMDMTKDLEDALGLVTNREMSRKTIIASAGKRETYNE